MNLISRKDALAQGLKHYFTGKPCKHGHVSHRFVSTRHCAACQQHHEQTYYAEKPEFKQKRLARAVRQYEEIKADPVKKAAYDERSRKSSAKFRAENQALCSQRSAASRLKKIDEYNAKAVQRQTHRLASDPEYRFTQTLRQRVLQAIKKCGAAKSAFTQDLLGCSYEEARQHLAAQFEEGMSWNNHGEWEIDHIRPCASFDLFDSAQQRECFHYTNLQPLWRSDNRKKRDRLDWKKAA